MYHLIISSVLFCFFRAPHVGSIPPRVLLRALLRLRPLRPPPARPLRPPRKPTLVPFDTLSPHHRASYCAAGVLCYDVAADGTLMILLCQFYGGKAGSRTYRERHSAWTVAGGKRTPGDATAEATAARELEEETGGLLDARRVEPLLRDGWWNPQGAFVLFPLRVSGLGDLPVRFAARASPQTEGRSTRALMWLPLDEAVQRAKVTRRGSWSNITELDEVDVDPGLVTEVDSALSTSTTSGDWVLHPFFRCLCWDGSLPRELQRRREEEERALWGGGIGRGWEICSGYAAADDGGGVPGVSRRKEEMEGKGKEDPVGVGGVTGTGDEGDGVWEADRPHVTKSTTSTTTVPSTSTPIVTNPATFHPRPLVDESLAVRLQVRAMRSSGMGGSTVATHSQYSCEICRIQFARPSDTAAHLKSASHRQRVQQLLVLELMNRLAMDEVEEEGGVEEGEDMVVSRGNRLHEPHPPDVSLVRDEGVVSSSTSRPEESPTIPTPTSPPSSAPSSLPLTPTAPSSSLFPMPNADFYEGQEVDFRNAWRTFSDPSVPHLRNPFTNPFQTRLRSHPRYTCEVCNIVFSRAADTATHLKSSLHRRNVQLLLLEEMRTVTPVEDGGDDAAMATVKEEEKRRDLISRESQDLIEDAVGGGGDDTDRRPLFLRSRAN